MYKYLVFGFRNYYPAGGMGDLKLTTNSVQEVKNFIYNWSTIKRGSGYENLQVYDAQENEIVYDAEFDVEDYLDKNARTLVLNKNKISV